MDNASILHSTAATPSYVLRDSFALMANASPVLIHAKTYGVSKAQFARTENVFPLGETYSYDC